MGQIAAIIIAAMLTSCATAPVPMTDPKAIWCFHNEARRPSSDVLTAMTSDEKREAIAHNRKGALWCGWQA